MKSLTLLTLFTLLLLFTGCSDDNPVAPAEESGYTITFNDLPGEITASAGVERQYQFRVNATSATGVPRSGLALTLACSDTLVKLQQFAEVTGSSGNIPAELTLTMPAADRALLITAKTTDREEIAVVTLHARPAPATLALFIEEDEVVIAPGAERDIPITVKVTDSGGRAVVGVTPQLELQAYGNGEVFGSLSAADPTDETGSSHFIFNNGDGSGRVTVIAMLPDSEGGASVDSVSKYITVAHNDQMIGELTIAAYPSFILAEERWKDFTSEVTARVVDWENVALEGVKVSFSTEYGSLTPPTLTDENGISHTTFSFQAANDWPDDINDNRISIIIRASVNGTPFSADKEIVIEQGNPGLGTLQLSHQVPFIFADNGLTSDTLTAWLKDADNQVLIGEPIIFTSTHGTVTSPVLTDSFGVAKSVFRDLGRPSTDELGNIVPAQIIAKYNPMSLTAVVECEIRERNPVDRIILVADKNQMQAGVGSSATVKATAFLANGDHAPNGTLVYFEVDMGTLSQNVAPILGNYGIAEVRYIAGGTKGNATMRACVDNGYERVCSNEWIITIAPGPPSSIEMAANPVVLDTGDPAALSTITATVIDEYGNSVDAGYHVEFETTMGTLERYLTTTDDQGRAVTYLRPGVSAGVAQVAARLVGQNHGEPNEIEGTTTVTFLASEANNLHLEIDDPEIKAGGYTIIRFRCTDQFGNIVETSRTFVMQLSNEPDPPEGAHFANGTLIDSVYAAGEGEFILYGGTISGGKLMRLHTWRDEERQDMVSVILSRLRVTAGDPAAIEISFDDEGERIGGGLWEVMVAARVTDEYGNPVEDGTYVDFSVYPDIATIESGETGGRSNGVVLVPMTYSGSHTFETVNITATIRQEGGDIEISLDEIPLPLQEGSIELDIYPDTWDIDYDGDRTNVRVVATVKDGYNNLVNYAPVQFGSSRAGFYWYDVQDDEYIAFGAGEPVRKLTGDGYDNDGKATVYLQGVEEDYFLDNVTPEINVNIYAEVDDYPDVVADPQVLVVTRHP